MVKQFFYHTILNSQSNSESLGPLFLKTRSFGEKFLCQKLEIKLLITYLKIEYFDHFDLISITILSPFYVENWKFNLISFPISFIDHMYEYNIATAHACMLMLISIGR
jgi:hypothetical protein